MGWGGGVVWGWLGHYSPKDKRSNAGGGRGGGRAADREGRSDTEGDVEGRVQGHNVGGQGH